MYHKVRYDYRGICNYGKLPGFKGVDCSEECNLNSYNNGGFCHYGRCFCVDGI